MKKNMPLTVGVFAIVALALPVALNACGEYQERKALRLETKAHVSAGQKALESKDFETSETAFKSALQLSPTDRTAQNGLAHSRAGRILQGNASTQRSDAIRLVYEIERALAEDAPNAAIYRLALAQLSGALNRTEAAKTWYQKATTTSGATAQAWLLKGQFELGLGDAKAALASLAEAIKLDDKSGEAYLYTGDAHMKDAKLAEAAQAYEKATTLLASATAWYRLGDAQLRQGEPAKAYQSLGKAADLHANATQDLNLVKRLGIAAFKVKRFDEAVRFLTQAAKLDKSADTLVNLSVAHQALNDHQTAIQMLGNVINQYPTNAAANLAAVTSLAYLNRREDAHRVGKKFVAFSSSNPRLKQTADRISKILAQIPLNGPNARRTTSKTNAANAALPRATAPTVQRMAPQTSRAPQQPMVAADAAPPAANAPPPPPPPPPPTETKPMVTADAPAPTAASERPKRGDSSGARTRRSRYSGPPQYSEV